MPPPSASTLRQGSAAAHLVKLQRRQALLTIVAPLLGVASWLVHFEPAPLWVSQLVGMYLLSMLGISVGYHRLLAHGAFQAGPWTRGVLLAFGCTAGQGPPVLWVANHRRHHQHSDRTGDPHSPHAGPTAHQQGSLWHAHLGWMLSEPPADILHYAPDLLRDRVVVGVGRYYRSLFLLGILLPGVVGGLITRSPLGLVEGALWGGLCRVALVQHLTWSINSVCHRFGSRPWQTKEESRNQALLGVLSLGEGWHNNHHAAPSSARFGLRWWELDLGYRAIWMLERLGLVQGAKLVQPSSRERHTPTLSASPASPSGDVP